MDNITLVDLGVLGFKNLTRVGLANG